MRRKVALFCVTYWILFFCMLATAAFLFYYGATQRLDDDMRIFTYGGGVSLVVVAIAEINSLGGFCVINEGGVFTKFKLLLRGTYVPVTEIKDIFICRKDIRSFKSVVGMTVVRANTEEGPILGMGARAIRMLVKELNVPVHLKDYAMSVTINAKVLLQKGRLSDYQAKMLIAASSWPKKYLNKWYDERQQ